MLSVSFFCGALTLAPAHQQLGSVVTILAVLWFVSELVLMFARNQWRALRSMPRPKWSLLEVMLICVAVLLGGLVGPHLLASHTNSTFVSWGLAGGVAVAVVACCSARTPRIGAGPPEPGRREQSGLR